MNLQDYIKGNRKGADAHRIEKDSMKDPFMYDAIDGFDSINDDHIKRINSIHKRLNRKIQVTKKKKYHYHLWQISAASVAAVLIFVVGGYFYRSNYRTNLYSENIGNQQGGVIKIYVPEDYYTENVVVIAKHNVEAVRTANIYKYNAAVKNDVEVVKAEDVLSGSDKVLDVYMPE